MPQAADPDALSYPAQGQMAASATHMPGPMPLVQVRAKLTAASGDVPPKFTWNEVEPDLNGNLTDKTDGLNGDANFNSAKELNGRSPPSFPWYVYLTPRIDTGSLGLVWDFELGCCS